MERKSGGILEGFLEGMLSRKETAEMAMTRLVNPTHGLRASYARGCRCEDCRMAWRLARRAKEPGRRARARARRLAESPISFRIPPLSVEPQPETSKSEGP